MMPSAPNGAVHHDLETLRDYFDWLVLLNVRIIEAGPVETTLNAANSRAAYGGRIVTVGNFDRSATPVSVPSGSGD
jgi:manganese/zinc/iron transport system ATP- binding protein